jgi:hypothetical protein
VPSPKHVLEEYIINPHAEYNEEATVEALSETCHCGIRGVELGSQRVQGADAVTDTLNCNKSYPLNTTLGLQAGIIKLRSYLFRGVIRRFVTMHQKPSRSRSSISRTSLQFLTQVTTFLISKRTPNICRCAPENLVSRHSSHDDRRSTRYGSFGPSRQRR